MRITGIDTHVLIGKLEGKASGGSQRVTGTRQAALCVISTDDGIEGLGEAFYLTISDRPGLGITLDRGVVRRFTT